MSSNPMPVFCRTWIKNMTQNVSNLDCGITQEGAEEALGSGGTAPIKTWEYILFLGLPLIVLVGLPLTYFCLDVANALKPLRVIVFAPVFGFDWMLHEAFNLHLPFPRALHPNTWGIEASFIRTFAFAVLNTVLTLPWFVWLWTRRRKYLAFGTVLLAMYIGFGAYFAAIFSQFKGTD